MKLKSGIELVEERSHDPLRFKCKELERKLEEIYSDLGSKNLSQQQVQGKLNDYVFYQRQYQDLTNRWYRNFRPID